MKQIFNFSIFVLLLAGNLHAEKNKLDKFLQEKNQRHSKDEIVRVIIQYYTTVVTSDVDNVTKKHNSRILRQLESINALAAEVLVDDLINLSAEPNISRLSVDGRVKGTGGLPTVASGASAATSAYNVDGNGIGVAVIDSGIAD